MRIKEYIPGWIREWIEHIRIAKTIPVTSMVSKSSKVYSGVTIGKHTYINGNSIVFCRSIGNYCSIGYNVQIGPPEHPLNYVSTHPRFYMNSWCEVTKTTVINHDVWIGSNAVILQGVTVGTGAVIGAGTVVTEDVPPYSIFFGRRGVPARQIRYRFTDDIIKQLLESEWWDWDETELASAHLNTINVFLQYIEQRQKNNA